VISILRFKLGVVVVFASSLSAFLFLVLWRSCRFAVSGQGETASSGCSMFAAFSFVSLLKYGFTLVLRKFVGLYSRSIWQV
jgi:predicted histidine transporter YuiF (NhaC family)